MKRNRSSEEQVIGILQEQEAGVSVADVCRNHGVSDASIYNGKPIWRFGGLMRSGSCRLSRRRRRDERTAGRRAIGCCRMTVRSGRMIPTIASA